jgi:hypothetical protein
MYAAVLECHLWNIPTAWRRGQFQTYISAVRCLRRGVLARRSKGLHVSKRDSLECGRLRTSYKHAVSVSQEYECIQFWDVYTRDFASSSFHLFPPRCSRLTRLFLGFFLLIWGSNDKVSTPRGAPTTSLTRYPREEVIGSCWCILVGTSFR